MLKYRRSLSRRGALIAVGLCVLMSARSVEGHTGHRVEVPSNLVINNQTFDASVTGLRMYLETLRTTNPELYAKLVPDVERLESRQTIARTSLVAGIGVGVGLVVFGVVTRTSCALPSVNDPNFAAGSARWDACNHDNMTRMEIFTLAGLAAMAGGGVVALATGPRRQDLLDVVNKHNGLNSQPLRLQIGYDPGHRFAHAGVGFAF
jgi:hypothetical protein